MTELNMYPTRSFVRIKATYNNRMPSGGVSYAPFRHFVLLEKYIVYGQGPIACVPGRVHLYNFDHMLKKCFIGMFCMHILLLKDTFFN